MKVKLFTRDKSTIDFIKQSVKYYNIKYDIIDTYNEDGTIKSTCFILEGIDGFMYCEGSTINNILPTIKLYYKNIAISLALTYIRDLTIDKEGVDNV